MFHIVSVFEGKKLTHQYVYANKKDALKNAKRWPEHYDVEVTSYKKMKRVR